MGSEKFAGMCLRIGPLGFSGKQKSPEALDLGASVRDVLWLPFLRTYRTTCLALGAEFRLLLEEAREIRFAAQGRNPVPVRGQPLAHAQDLISDLPNNGIGCPIGVGHFAEEDAVQYPVSLSTGQPSDI